MRGVQRFLFSLERKQFVRFVRAHPLLLIAGLLLVVYGNVLSGLQPTARAETRPQQPVAESTPASAPSNELALDDIHGDGEAPLGESFQSAYDRLAGQSAPPDASPDEGLSPTGGNWTWIAFTAVAVLAGAVYGGSALFRRYGGRMKPGGPGQWLTIQESRPLSANQHLHLVRLGDEVLLIGATDHHISLLARLDAEGLPDSFSAHLQEAAQGPGATEAVLGGAHLVERLQSLRAQSPLAVHVDVKRGGGGDD